MSQREAIERRYPTIEFVLGAVAGWIEKYRSMQNAYDELGHLSQEEALSIAKDLGVPVSELRALATKTPGSESNLSTMLRKLSLNPAKDDPVILRDLQRTCIHCGQKSRCRHEIADGTATEHFREFCPNSYTLDALLKQREQSRCH